MEEAKVNRNDLEATVDELMTKLQVVRAKLGDPHNDTLALKDEFLESITQLSLV